MGWRTLTAWLSLVLILAAPLPAAAADPLVVSVWGGNWKDTVERIVAKPFTAKTGIPVEFEVGGTLDRLAKARVAKGAPLVDVTFTTTHVGRLYISDGLFEKLDLARLPNARDLAREAVRSDYHLGVWAYVYTIAYRPELVKAEITRWADLWDPRYAGRVAVWPIQRYLMGVALHTLGYSINSEEPQELEAALERLLILKTQALLIDLEWETAAPLLVDGQAVMAMGWAADVWETRAQRDDVLYVLPEEGALLWGDNFVIPSISSRKATAEAFLNFVLRPEISARFSNENHYATPNEAAWPLVDPEILADPVIYPPNEDLENAEILLPLSPAGQRLYDELWERFLGAEP